ncbi:MAG: gluconokinase [Solirubrobacteraceae bacterium]|nr:gluconokinase [Patulibacter sp.]
MAPASPTVLVVMGVSGSGKTTTGRALADRLGWPFQEGDALHPAANIAKMAAGTPLTDVDRAPWLAAVAARISSQLAEGGSGVVTCSALRRRYRDQLRGDHPAGAVRFVYLRAPAGPIHQRLADRTGHFMPASLLGSQVEALEPPDADEHALVVDALRPVGEQVDDVLAQLASDDN